MLRIIYDMKRFKWHYFFFLIIQDFLRYNGISLTSIPCFEYIHSERLKQFFGHYYL